MTDNQNSGIQQIQPSQALRILEALKEELAKAKAVGQDTQEGKAHLFRAQQLKQVLTKFQQQQRQAQAQSRPSPQAQGVPGTPGQLEVKPAPPRGRLGTDASAEKYNQVLLGIKDLERKIQAFEAAKRPDMSPEEAAQNENLLKECRLKHGQLQKFAVYIKTQLMDQQRSEGSEQARGTSPAGYSTQMRSQPTAPQSGSGTSTPPGLRVPIMSKPEQKGRSSSPGKDTGLTGITKTSVPSMPIANTINVKPPNPVTMKLGGNNSRPTLTGGSALGLGQVMSSPAVVRMPTFDIALTSAGPIQDNGGRVLTKRKLTELVNTIGADEGDRKTTIDGDVEELLLDLADEFVSSVTSFACRLAKHRKTDNVDVRDVQLHLERNWNIRIPGYAMDEIRSTRKWQPLSAYNQKVSGIEIAKAVNGNMN